MDTLTASQSEASMEPVIERGVVLDPLSVLDTVVMEKDPPPYGAQHRQDALWKGGNEALPPLWQEFQVLRNKTRYVDNNLYMGSWNRPLPGVRLDPPGDLAPGCEWYISPLGRSYFVNHNTRTTSWKRPTPGWSAESLTPECTIEGHSKAIWDLAYLGTSCNIMSASVDGSIRRWTREGKVLGKPLGNGEVVSSIAVSPDETMVVSGSAKDGKVRLWNITEGGVVGDPWEGHTATVRSLDWSPNALEIASGSEDGTIRRWNPDTGRQLIRTVETGHGWVIAVKYSPQGDKLASCGMDKTIRVWSHDGGLLNEIKGHTDSVTSLCWSKDGTHIFSGSASLDCTIRKWRLIDGKELFVLQGHSNKVVSLCLSPDESHLVSASRDCSIRIWDLKSHQPVGNPLLHPDEICVLARSLDGKYIASGGTDAKVYVWNIEVALGNNDVGGVHGDNADADTPLKGRTAPSTSRTNNRVARYSNDFWDNDPNHHPIPRTGFSPLRGRRVPNDQPWRWKLRWPSFGLSTNVAPARDDDRYGITPPSDAEVAAAMKPTGVTGNNQASGAQGPRVGMHGQSTQTTSHRSDPDSSDVIGCCGFYLVRRQSRRTGG